MPRLTHSLSPQEQALLRETIQREGLAAFARRAGASRDTLARLAAGLEGRNGSIALVRSALGQLEARVG